MPVRQVSNYQLVAWQAPEDKDHTLHNALAVWQGYIPSDQVQDLQNAVNDPDSALYTQQRSAQTSWIVSFLKPNFSVTTNAGKPKSSTTTATPTGSTEKSRTIRNVVVGVCVSFGGILLLALGVFFFRRHQQKKAAQAVIRRPASIRSTASGAGALRQTWVANHEEQQRALGGPGASLTETWSHFDGQYAGGANAPHLDPFGDEQEILTNVAVAGGAANARQSWRKPAPIPSAPSSAVAHSPAQQHAYLAEDPFASDLDAAEFRRPSATSVDTAPSQRTDFTGYSSESLTPSQRIQMEYEASHQALQHAPEMTEVSRFDQPVSARNPFI